MKKGINKVVKLLILSDIALLGGLGFIAPIFAIFLTDRIEGGSVEVAGFAAAIYLIVKSIFVIPFGKYLDRNHGEKDDLWFVVISTLLVSFVVFGYIFSKYTWHIYSLQALYGIAMAMNVPSYTAIFTRHIDQDKEAFDWSVRSCLTGIGAGLAGALGGIVANYFGFNILFMGIGTLIFFSSFLPFLIKKDIFPSNEKSTRIPKIKTGDDLDLKL